MSAKTKILSFLLLLLLSLSFILNTNKQGNVLGVVEEKSGEIASGIVDTKDSKKETFKGRAVWKEDLKSAVSTNKFALATGVLVEHETQSLNLVVGDNTVNLEEGAVIVLDKETFQNLGGDPSSQSSIEVVVSKN
jgi:hypothetical protein